MRTIRFRGQRVDNGEWVYGYYTESADNENYYYWVHEHNQDIHDVKKETVEQFTGLYDKNGAEIYEGDILKLTYEINLEISYHEVKYGIDENYPAFDLNPSLDYADFNNLQYLTLCKDIYSFEVIGNIHDNKELL